MHNVIKIEYCDHFYEMKIAGIHAKYMDSSCFVLKILIEKSLCGAVPEQCTMSTFGYSQLQVPFGILLVELHFVSRSKCYKRDVILFFHGVVSGQKPVVFDDFHMEFFAFLCLFGCHGFQTASAAGDGSVPCGECQITAVGTDKIFRFFHVFLQK